MRALALLPFVLLAAVAPAQSARVDRPLRLEVGAFFPNYRGASFGHDFGVAAALGYAFVRKGDVELVGSLRGAYHLASLGGADDGGAVPSVGPDEGNLSVSSAFVDARYAPARSRFFVGVGLGVGQANVDGGEHHAGLLLAVEGGYRLSSAVYVAVRYQHAGPDALRGATVSLGFRL